MRNQYRRGKNVRSSQYLKRWPSPGLTLFAAFRLLPRTRTIGHHRDLASRSVTNIALDPWPGVTRTEEKIRKPRFVQFQCARGRDSWVRAIARGDRNSAAGEVNPC